ncbi:unnamed protein product [Adineta ricciae]|uniref:Uncharacterized protein n=1 Tax=Adineta ricciae TaxID=249248 RepID=A0A814KYC2_ADIRI|nr:unnamed protein product [Adineta ricciae]CAF1587454.1 unnamed protein product [Adineta ricciae]
MTDEKILLEALTSSDFKVSIHDKKRTDAEATKMVIENKQQLGEQLDIDAINKKNDDRESLLTIYKSMPSEQQKKVIEILKQSGLADPLTKENIVQNAFTVDKTIRDNA